MSKVRYVNWSPDEWIAGTFGVLTIKQAAVYMAVLMQIYSRGGQCPNDAAFIAKHFVPDVGENERGMARSARASIDRLVVLGKLHVSADGEWLTNGRADSELGRAHGRIETWTKAGVASGAARRRRPADMPSTSPRHPSDIRSTSPPHAANAKSKSNHINGLSRTDVPLKNHDHEPSPESSHKEISTVAARATEPSLALGPAHDTGQTEQYETAVPRSPPMVGRARRMPAVGNAVGPPDPEAIRKLITDLGVDPDAVETPPAPKPAPAPADDPAQKSSADLLAEKAAAARRKLLSGG